MNIVFPRIGSGSGSRWIGAIGKTYRVGSATLSIRHSSMQIEQRSRRIDQRSMEQNITYKKFKGDHHAYVLLQPLKLHPNQEKVRQSIHSAMKMKQIKVKEWSALNNFVDAVICQDELRIKLTLKEILLDLGWEQQDLFFMKGRTSKDPLFMQISAESEDLILRIVGIVLAIRQNKIHSICNPLFVRYYQLGLHSHSEQLLTIAGGMKNLPIDCRNNVISTRLKCKQYKDYYEVFEEYRQYRNWCLKEKIQDPFENGWLRIIYRLTKANVSDTEITPTIPIELTSEIFKDRDKFGVFHPDEPFMLECFFLDHYIKNIARSDSFDLEWLSYLQRVVISIHKGLVDRHGKELKRDPVVFSSLLNAYGYAKMPAQAFEIWDRMISFNVELDSACFSVMFDVCGMSGQLSVGRKVLKSIKNSERALELMNKNVWDSWLECLCRCDAVEEAVTSALSAMEAALRKREELKPHDTKHTGTSKKFYAIYAIRSELEGKNNENHRRYISSDQNGGKQTDQARRFSSKGLSDCRPDASTFTMLLRFARSRQNKLKSEVHGEILWRLNQSYPDLLPFIKAYLIVSPSRHR